MKRPNRPDLGELPDNEEARLADGSDKVIVHFLGFGMTACLRAGVPKDWPANHVWSSSWEQVTCPDCLKGKEPIDTFTLSADGRSITCKRCQKTSYNPSDIENHYCGWCHVFHDDIWPPCRQTWIDNPQGERQTTWSVTEEDLVRAHSYAEFLRPSYKLTDYHIQQLAVEFAAHRRQ